MHEIHLSFSKIFHKITRKLKISFAKLLDETFCSNEIPSVDSRAHKRAHDGRHDISIKFHLSICHRFTAD